MSPNQLLIITATPTRVEIEYNHDEVVQIQESNQINLHQSCKITTNGITFNNNATELEQKRVMELKKMKKYLEPADSKIFDMYIML